MYRAVPLIIIVVAIAFGFLAGGVEKGGRGIRDRAQQPWQPRRRQTGPDYGRTKPWSPGDKRAARGGRALPPPSQRDPAVFVKISEEKRNSSGTAFSISANGVWMTARHVADGCERIFILTAPRKGMRVRRVYIHPNADVALLKTDRGAPPLAFSAAVLRVGQDGFHMGYPKGQPGDVNSLLLGRSVMRVRGRYRTSEPVVAWTERVRIPESSGGLGGISGGPAFDQFGRVIGVNVAGSKRRGRVFTAAPRSIRAAMQRAGFSPPGDARPAFSEIDRKNFSDVGRRLRRTLQIAKVLCFAPKHQRRRQRWN